MSEFLRVTMGVSMLIGRAGFSHSSTSVRVGIDQGIHNYVARGILRKQQGFDGLSGINVSPAEIRKRAIAHL